MATRMSDTLMGSLAELRYEPVDKRIRAVLHGQTIIDTVRPIVVWEPERVVPSYAVPSDDISGKLRPDRSPPEAASRPPRLGGRPVLDDRIPFSIHTTDGERLEIVVNGGHEHLAAFRAAEPALEGYVIVDFHAFDAWYEEDELTVGHPRDPFHRIEILHSSRHVRVEVSGRVVAESGRPYLLFEPPLPVRYYLPRGDVVAGVLQPSDTTTYCAYKGRARYWSLDGEADIAWSYPHPLHETAEIADRIAFFNERTDHIVDGRRLRRPVTPWSPDPASR